ncbi:MAG: strawberry notch family protein, partial [Rhodobacteraceae bacterium]|nr:strawberry notch family protein [Paracoccaceae bacterium]
MFSLPKTFLESFYHHYGPQMGMPFEEFAQRTGERDKKDLEELADILYNEKYANYMERDDFDQRSGLIEWRDEQPNAAQIVGSRVADRATKLAGGASEAVDSAIDWLGYAFQPTPTAGYGQHAGGQPVRDAEQREAVTRSSAERDQRATQSREFAAAYSNPLGRAIIEGAGPLGKKLREHEGKYEQERYTSWEELLESPLKNFLPYALEEGVVSLPDMVAAVANLPGYAAARAGEIAGERAENELRDDADVGDFFAALPAAVASAGLERIGASKVFGLTDKLAEPVAGEGAKGVAKRVGGALARRSAIEGATEAIQEPIEQVGASAGTEAWKGKPTQEIAAQLLQGSLQGGVTGALAGGAISTPTTAAEEISRRRKMKDDSDKPPEDAAPTQPEPTPTPPDTGGDGVETTTQADTPQQQQPAAEPGTSGSNIINMDAADRDQSSLNLEALAAKGKRQLLNPGDLVDGQRVEVDYGNTPSAQGTVKMEGGLARVFDEEGNLIGTVRDDEGGLAENPLVYNVKEEKPSAEMETYSLEFARLMNSWVENEDPQSLEAMKKLRNSKEWTQYPEQSRNVIDEIIRDGEKRIADQEAEATRQKEQEAKDKADAEAKAEEERVAKERSPVSIGEDIEVTWSDDTQLFTATHKPTGKVFSTGSKKDSVLKDATDTANNPEAIQALVDSPQTPVKPKPDAVTEPEPEPEAEGDAELDDTPKIDILGTPPKGWTPETAGNWRDRDGKIKTDFRTNKQKAKWFFERWEIDQESKRTLKNNIVGIARQFKDDFNTAAEIISGQYGVSKKVAEEVLKMAPEYYGEDPSAIIPDKSPKEIERENEDRRKIHDRVKANEILDAAFATIEASSSQPESLMQKYNIARQQEDIEKAREVYRLAEQNYRGNYGEEEAKERLRTAAQLDLLINELDAVDEADMEYDEVHERILDFMETDEFRALPENVKTDARRYIRAGSGSLKSLMNFIAGDGTDVESVQQGQEDITDIEEEATDAEFGDTSDVVEDATVEPEPEPEQKPGDPVGDFSFDILANLSSKRAMDNPSFFKMAEEAFGGTVGEGAFDPQQAYNIGELAMNQYAAMQNMIEMDSARALEVAQDLDDTHKLLPTQTRRTDKKIAYQQFSTPPGYAMAVNWAAGVGEGDQVLEPSAGAGGLAVMARQMGGNVTVNEIEKDRLDVLGRMFGGESVWNEDANHLPAIKSEARESFDVVVMNPPFSNEGARGLVKQGRVTEAHVLAAMKMVAPGGRLVIISGPSFDVRKPGVVSSAMKKEGTIRAVVGMDGSKLYRKYGTTFDNNVTVWDKVTHEQTGVTTIVLDAEAGAKALATGVLPKHEPIVEGRFDNLPDFIKAMEPVRESRGETRNETRPVAPDEGGTTVLEQDGESGETAEQGGGVQHPASSNVGGGKRAESSGESEGRGKRGTVAGGPRDGDPGGDVSGDADRNSVGGRRSAQGSPDGGGKRARPDKLAMESPSAVVEAAKIGEEDKFASYRPTVGTHAKAQPHPGILVESATMGTVNYPSTINYAPSIPEEVISSGGISGAQLEKVVLAGHSHSQMIQGGVKRKGFIDGDGTGSGKGRSIVATIYDNYQQGRKKAVWFSISKNLIHSSKDDFEGVGWKDANVIPATTKAQWTKIAKNNEGIVFSMYSQLAGRLTAQEKQALEEKREGLTDLDYFPRVKLLVDWLGEDFDGVIVFDEAHQMKNAMAVESESAQGRKTKSSRTAQAGLALQNALPNARIYYATATAATEPENLGYLDRLGLWGEGTDFANAQNFVSAISAGGTAGMELVARDLKQMGVYASRSLSYDGVQYEKLEHTLTPEQKQMYDTSAHAWQKAMRDIEAAIGETMPGATEKDKARTKGSMASKFWGDNQRYYNLLMTSMQMPTVIKEIEKDFADGKSVVVQLTNTNEAEQKRQVEKIKGDDDLQLEDIDITPREMLINVITNSYPTAIMQPVRDPESGTIDWKYATDSKGELIQDPALVAKKQALIDEVAAFQLPGNPLDMLLEHFGYDNFAEVSGRSSRIVRKDGKTYEETGLQRKKRAEISAFRDGDKLGLVFTRGGGTGEGYHAGNQFKNKRQRVHFVLQPGWSADTTMQFLGRTHRTDQASAPIYKLVQTNQPAQKRFVATIARRLGQLGALTKGQRDTTGGLFGDADNLEDQYGKGAVNAIIERLQDEDTNRFGDTGISNADVLSRMDLAKAKPEDVQVKQFLNRMLNLESDVQGHLFTLFDDARNDMIEGAVADGTYDTGVEVVKVEQAKIADRQVINVEERSGAETEYLKIAAKRRIKKTAYGDVVRRAEKFYLNKTSGSIFSARPLAAKHADAKTGRMGTRYSMQSIKTSSYAMEWDLKDANKWEEIDEFAKAKELWEKQYEETSELGDTSINMISGAVLPIYGKLGSNKSDLPKVKRVIMDDGSNILGMEMNRNQLKGLFRRLGVGMEIAQIPPQALYDYVMENPVSATLNDGSMLRPRLLSGELRLEVSPSTWQRQSMMSPGGLMDKMGFQFETINHRRSAFVPTSSGGIEVLARYMENKQVESVREKHTNKDVMDQISYHRPFVTPKKLVRDNKREVFEDARRIVERIAPFATYGQADTIQGGATGSLAFDPETLETVLTVALNTADDPRRIVRHEAIHALKSMGLFSKEEWSALKRQADKQGWFKTYQIQKRYPDEYNGAVPNETAYEEAIAEAYSHWAVNRTSTSAIATRVFKRITDFFRRMVASLRNYGAQPSVGSIFEAVESGKVGRRKPQPQAKGRTSRHVEFDDADREARWQSAAEGVNLTAAGRIREAATDSFRLFTRTWKHLPNDKRSKKKFAEFHEMAYHLSQSQHSAKEKVRGDFERVAKGLGKEDIDLMTRKWVLDDLLWTAGQGMEVPFGYASDSQGDATEKILADLRSVEAKLAEMPHLQERVDLRNKLRDQVAKEMISSGVLTRQQARNPNYFRHQVLEYAQGMAARARAGKTKNPFWHGRKGSEKDINVNYFEAESEWMFKAYTDIATARLLKRLKASKYNLADDLRMRAKKSNASSLNKMAMEDSRIDAALKNRNRAIGMSLSFLRAEVKANQDTLLDVIDPKMKRAMVSFAATGRSAAAEGEYDAKASIFRLMDALTQPNIPESVARQAQIAKASMLAKKKFTADTLGNQYINPLDMEGMLRKLMPDDYADYAVWQPDSKAGDRAMNLNTAST